MAITIQQALSNLSRSLDSYFYYATNANLTISVATESESESETPDILLFQYTIEDIFDKVKMLSANMGKFAISEKAGDMFDRITVTEEDRSLFMMFAKSAAMYAYTKVQGLAKFIDPGFLFNEGVEIVEWVPGGSYLTGTFVYRNGTIYKALDDLTTDPEVDTTNWEEMPDYVDTWEKVTYLLLNSDNFDANAVRVWNDNLFDIIVMYILEKIFKFRNIGENMMAIVLDERITKERELMTIINSRKSQVRRYVAWM